MTPSPPAQAEASETVERHAIEIAVLREALKFYSNPFAYTERVPDFYREMSFGDTADNALARPFDPTAQTGPLTTGQEIVGKYEADMIAEPCELAAMIDAALQSERKRADIAETALVDVTRNLLSDAQSERDSRDRRIAELEAALVAIKARVVGDRHPGWRNDDATTGSRLYIADVCDRARTPGEKS